MFHFLKGKNKENVLYAPCKGKVVPLSEVPDPTFSEKILGDGFAVIPSEGKIYAPTDGEIAMVFDTLHAVTLTSTQGAEILIHIGLDCSRRSGQKRRSSDGCRSGQDHRSRIEHSHSGTDLQYR